RLVRRRRHRPDHPLSRGRKVTVSCACLTPDMARRAMAGRRARDGRRGGYREPMPELAGTVADAFASRIRAAQGRTLWPRAVRSYETRGRARDEEECLVRTPFQRDRDRIVHSKPFRRLKEKTQVFIDPGGDHYRTRMTHTLETTGIARVVARALAL